MTAPNAPRPTLKLTFGALVPSIREQLVGREMKSKDPSLWVMFQRAADSICYIVIHGYITPAESDRARRRLLAAIEKELKP